MRTVVESGQDSLCTSINSPCQTTRLPLQMKLHVHIQQVLKGLPGDFTDRALGYTGEQGVAQFAEGGGEYSRCSVYHISSRVLGTLQAGPCFLLPVFLSISFPGLAPALRMALTCPARCARVPLLPALSLYSPTCNREPPPPATAQFCPQQDEATHIQLYWPPPGSTHCSPP